MEIQELLDGFTKNKEKRAFQTKKTRYTKAGRRYNSVFDIYLDFTMCVGLGSMMRMERWPEVKLQRSEK